MWEYENCPTCGRQCVTGTACPECEPPLIPKKALDAWKAGEHHRVVAALRADGYDVPGSVAAIEAAIRAEQPAPPTAAWWTRRFDRRRIKKLRGFLDA